MANALIGIAVGVVALLAAWWLNVNQTQLVTDITAAITTASAVLGFFGVTIGLGTIGAAAQRDGFTSLTMQQVSGPGVVALAGGLLLAAAR
jgi:hypothetical protein